MENRPRMRRLRDRQTTQHLDDGMQRANLVYHSRISFALFVMAIKGCRRRTKVIIRTKASGKLHAAKAKVYMCVYFSEEVCRKQIENEKGNVAFERATDLITMAKQNYSSNWLQRSLVGEQLRNSS